jgi:putative ubiquitin-RnfH superfamily antitoxin RatB of RatAB toxin-antitoxin module
MLISPLASSMKNTLMQIQICYASPQSAIVCHLMVPEKLTLQEAIADSGILILHPEIDIANCRVGIFGKLKDWGTVLKAGDRVEIYRPLIAAPMESRRRRAAKQSAS